MIPARLVALRPRQWVKNLLVFGAPLFAFVTDPDELLKVVGAFVSFCAVSSAVYLLNDCLDLKQDRLHPVKKRRPLASGQISASTAILAAILLGIAGLGLAFRISKALVLVIGAYILIQLAYNLILKRVLILDIMALASGFVLRAVAGGFAAPGRAFAVVSLLRRPGCLLCGSTEAQE